MKKNKDFSIYVHIPFCISKCNYCDFNSYANIDNLIDIYCEKLIKEINDDNNFLKDSICRTIYFGGGTPSYIPSDWIERILETIKEKYVIDENAEMTIEVNPSSVTEEKTRKYFDIGFNRISIGLQTTDDELLQLLGRKHTYKMFCKKYELIQKVGFTNINVDLMLALPNQTMEMLKLDLDRLIDLKPSHISCYSLIVYENLQLYKDIQKGIIKLPNENEERNMYHYVQKMLKNNGYNQYEISNFSIKALESKHNLMCWRQNQYIGFGAGASSFVDNVRFKNIENLQEYIANNQKIIEEVMDVNDLMSEYMLLGFRCIESIDIEEFKKKFNISVYDKYEKEIQELFNKGLIYEKNKKIYLTNLGIDFNNMVCSMFI